MSDHQRSSGLSLKVMMLGLVLVMAVAGAIAYLLVYPFFHRQHTSETGGGPRYRICARQPTIEPITQAV